MMLLLTLIPIPARRKWFFFAAFDPWALYGAWVEALTIYRRRDLWKRLVVNCMKEDFSWPKAAGEYEEMYKTVVKG